MKKLLLTAMIAALLAVPFQGVALAGSLGGSPSQTASAQTQDRFIPGNVPAATGTLDSMTPAVHAMVLAALTRDGNTFDFQDESLCWEALYNMLSLYGQMDDRAVYDEEENLILPAEIANDFSAAFFPGTLGQLPESLSDRMTYHEEEDSYHLVCGNDSLAQIQLTNLQEIGEFLIISGSLVYLVDGSDLAQFQVTLIPQDNLFGYTITELEIL